MNIVLLKAAGVRALRTAIQTMIATIGSTAMLQEINLPVVASVTCTAALLSFLQGILAGLPEVE